MQQLPFTRSAESALQSAISEATLNNYSLVTVEALILALNLDLPSDFLQSLKQKVNRTPISNTQPSIDHNLQKVIMNANVIASKRGDNYISHNVLIQSLCELKHFKEHTETIKDKYKQVDKVTSHTDINSEISDFAVEMVSMALKGKYDPVVGREDTVRSVTEILSKKIKSNVILVGSPGVGKTAIVTALANDIANGKIPALNGYKLYNVDIGSIIAGTGVRGEFEERFKKIIKEAAKGNTILFIDEVHMLISAGNKEGTCDAANMLKPQLASGEIKCIGATTYAEYRKYIEKDHALARRFVKIDIPEPNIEDSVTMLRGLRARIEAHHGTQIRDDALVAAAKMAKKYIPGRKLPDSAIDLVDTACAAGVLSRENEPDNVVKMRGKIWSLGLKKASLEMDMKNKLALVDSQSKYPQEDSGKINNNNFEEKSHKDGHKKNDDEIKNAKNEISIEIKNLEHQINLVNNELRALNDKLEPALKAHTEQREGIEECKRVKQQIEEKRIRYDDAVRARDEYTAAEIRNFVIPGLMNKLKELQSVLVSEITPLDIASVVSKLTNVPVTRLTIEENQRLLGMAERMKKIVFGQDDAIDTVVNSLLTSRVGFSDPGRPIGTFLFLGPTGVGKTELAKAVSYEMFDTEKSVTIDMSDYTTEIDASKLIGVSAGYVGYGEGGTLTEPVKNKPYNLILLDEVDLAHPRIFNILYQLFDEGRITDGTGNEIDYSNCIIIMTSNIGYTQISEPNFTKEKAEKETMKKFGMALFNRIDSIVHFNPLGPEILDNLFTKNLKIINQRLSEEKLNVIIEDEVKEDCLSVCCTDVFGARPLKKYMQREIVGGAARVNLIRGDSKKFGVIYVSMKDQGMKFGKYWYEYVEE